MELVQMHELIYILFQIIALSFKVRPLKIKKSKTLRCMKEMILYKWQKENWCWYFSTLLFQKWVEHPCGQKFAVRFCMKCILCTLHFEVSVLLFKMLLCRWCMKVLLLIVLPWRQFSAINLSSLMRVSLITEEALGFISNSSLQGISIALTSLLSLLIGFILGALYWKVRDTTYNCLHGDATFLSCGEVGIREPFCIWKQVIPLLIST